MVDGNTDLRNYGATWLIGNSMRLGRGEGNFFLLGE